VLREDASGTVDQSAGSSAITIPLSSYVYLTGNPKVCINGAPGTDGTGLCTTDANCGGTLASCQNAPACPVCTTNSFVTNRCIGGANHNNAAGCTPVGAKRTSHDCPPKPSQFISPLGVTLSPLGTGASMLLADASGKFCGASQRTAGAFGKTTARRIEEAGSPAGALSDNAPHAVTIAASFCIPATGNAIIDGGTGADLPGPGAVSISGTFQTSP
jgi:hypothetical protein